MSLLGSPVLQQVLCHSACKSHRVQKTKIIMSSIQRGGSPAQKCFFSSLETVIQLRQKKWGFYLFGQRLQFWCDVSGSKLFDHFSMNVQLSGHKRHRGAVGLFMQTQVILSHVICHNCVCYTVLEITFRKLALLDTAQELQYFSRYNAPKETVQEWMINLYFLC